MVAKGEKTPTKGVRFADLVDPATEAEVGRGSEGAVRDIADVNVIVKKREDHAGEGRETIEMDSVDFDKVTGTSTPIDEDSPSLPKHSSSVDGAGRGVAIDTSSEQEEREEVIEAVSEKHSLQTETNKRENLSESHMRVKDDESNQRLHRGMNVDESLPNSAVVDHSVATGQS